MRVHRQGALDELANQLHHPIPGRSGSDLRHLGVGDRPVPHLRPLLGQVDAVTRRRDGDPHRRRSLQRRLSGSNRL